MKLLNVGALFVTSTFLGVTALNAQTTINTTVMATGGSQYDTGIIFDGGELITNDNMAVAFSTSGAITITSNGGTIAATTGTVATYSGSISDATTMGPFGVLQVGDSNFGDAGTVVFTAANNTFAGGTQINFGTLQTDASGALGPGALIIKNGTLDLNGTTQTVGTVTLGSSGTTFANSSGTAATLNATSVTIDGPNNTIDANVTLANTGLATIDTGATMTVNGAITGNVAVNKGIFGAGTLAGSGSVGGTTDVTGSTVNGSGLTLTGLTTFHGAGNSLQGTVTSTNGVTVASGGAVTLTGTLTGNLTNVQGTFTDNSAITGSAGIGSGGTLAGNGSVGLTTDVTGGTIHGTGLTLTGLTTFHGASNFLSGTDTATSGVTVASGGSVTQSGTLTGSLTNVQGTFTANGVVTGSVAISSGGTLAGSGTVDLTTDVTSGTVTGSGLTLTGLTTFHGIFNMLTGTVTAPGGVTVAAGGTAAQGGTLTGSLTNVQGVFAANGIITGNVVISAGGALGGVGGTVDGTTDVTDGSVSSMSNSTNLTLTGVTTFHGAGNGLFGAVASTNGVTLASGAALADNGALTGNITVGNGTLSGNGSVSGTTSVTGGAVNGSGLTLTGVTTFNGGGNSLSGPVTSTNGVTLASGAALADNGTLTGNITVGNGTLSGNGSISGTTSVTGGTVDGSGLILTGVTTVHGAGNTFSGTLTSTNGVALASGAALAENATLTSGIFVGNGTLTGTGSVSGLVTVTGGSVDGTGLQLNGGTSFSGAGDILSGTESGNVFEGAGASVTQSGVLTGNVTLTNGASTLFTGSGTVGTVTLNGGGDTVSSNTTLTTSGLIVNGTNNTVSGSGAVSGGASQSANSGLAVNGTLTGADDLLAGTTALTGTGTISGLVTLNGGGTTVSSTNTLSTGGLTVNGIGNTITGGTISGLATINSGGSLIVNSGATSGPVMVSGGGTLGGTGTTGNVTVASTGAINLQDNVRGTLTVGNLSVTAGALTFEIGSTLGSNDNIVAGALTIGGGTTTISVVNLPANTTLTNGTYTLLTYTGAPTGLLSDFSLSTTSLDGHTLMLSTSTAGEINLDITTSTTGTTYNLTSSISAVNGRVISGGTTTVTATITNTGSGTADTLNYTGLTTNGSLSGGTLPKSGGPVANNNGADSGTATLSVGGITGTTNITPTVGTATNATIGGNATLGTVTSTTLDVVADRVVTATPITFGRVMSGVPVSGISTLTSPGSDLNFTRVTVGTAGPDFNGISATGGNTALVYNGSTSDTRTVGGTFSIIGPLIGQLTLTTTGEGLTGENPIDVAIHYTADSLNNRSEFATAVNLGRVIVGQTTGSQTTTISSIPGQDSSLTRITLGAGALSTTGVSNGTITVTNGAAYTFGGANDLVNSTTAGVTGSFTVAGTQSGTAVLTPTGEGLTGEVVNTIGIGYTVDPVTKRLITDGAPSDLGLLHSGAALSAVVSTPFTTSGTHDTTTDVTVAAGSGVADGNGVTLTGGPTTFNGAISQDTRIFGGNINSVGGGTTMGSFGLAVTGEGLTGEGPYSNVNVAYTAFVYTGQGVWNTNGSGSWGAISATPANWTADGGVPGITSGFTTTDSATFGSALTSGSATVSLNGDSPSLNAITFNDAAGSYTIAQGTSGTLKLNNGASAATVTDSAGSHAISAPVELDSNATVSVTNVGDTLTLSGVIGDLGAGKNLTVSGAGTVLLSGANTYSGATAIQSGTLQLGLANELTNSTSVALMGGTLDLAGNNQTLNSFSGTAGIITNSSATLSTLMFNSPVNPVASTITGNLSVAQNSAGLLVLTGGNSYTGVTTINSGTVQAGNATALGAGSVTNSGTLGSFGSNHVIGVGANYVQNSGGTLDINLTSNPGSNPGVNDTNDVLSVGGTASLGGRLALTLTPSVNFTPAIGQTFVIVEANTANPGSTNGVTTVGTGFTTGIGTVAGLALTGMLTDNNNDLVVTITSAQLQLTSIPGLVYTPNQAAVANYISNHITTGPLFTAFVNVIATDPNSLPAIQDQLSPEKFENFARNTVFDNAVYSTLLLDDYLAGLRSPQGDFVAGNGQIDCSGLTISDPNADPALTQVRSRLLAWTPAPLEHGLLSDTAAPVLGGIDMKEMKPEVAEDKGHDFNVFVMGNAILAQGFSQTDLAHSDTTTGAVQLGADYRVTSHLRTGVVFGYGHTDGTLDNLGSKATLDSYAPGAYVSYANKGWYANGLATYGFNNFTEDRHVSFGGFSGVAHGAPSGNQVLANLDGGYDFHMKNWTFGPLAGLQYTYISVDPFSEDGASAVDLQINRQETDSMRSRLGGHVSYAFQTGKVVLTPHLDASWQHEFLDDSQGISSQFTSVGTGSFTIGTPNPSRDSALIDTGLNADLNGQVSVFADYLVQAGQSNYFGQSVQAGVKIGF